MNYLLVAVVVSDVKVNVVHSHRMKITIMSEANHVFSSQTEPNSFQTESKFFFKMELRPN